MFPFSPFVVKIFHMVLCVRINRNVNFRIGPHVRVKNFSIIYRGVMVIIITKDERYVKDQYVNQMENMCGIYCIQWILLMNRVTANPNAEVT
jgi:hypothetical protein